MKDKEKEKGNEGEERRKWRGGKRKKGERGKEGGTRHR